MTDPARLVLVTPAAGDPAAWPGRLAGDLEAAVGAGPVDAVILRVPRLDERSLVKLVKPLAAMVQASNAALLLEDAPEAVIRAGADGAHLTRPETLEAALGLLKPHDRIVGLGGLRARHDAMEAAEAGCDYVMFGEPREDGTLPPLPAVVERAAWWAEVFQVPCVAFCPALEAVGEVAATGCEFVALGEAVFGHPEGAGAAVRQVLAALAAASGPQR